LVQRYNGECPLWANSGQAPSHSINWSARVSNVGGINFADAAAFLSPQTGWVTGTYWDVPAKGKSRYQQRIVATSDGGKTWQTQWASPWTDGTGV